MIGTSTREYIFIRLCILFLRWIAPLSVFYCFITFILGIPHYRTFWISETFIVAETVFYFCVYIPRARHLQAAATHPPPLPYEERYKLFRLCHENVPDPESYLSKWFLDAPLSEIKRENVKDFLRWAFLNKQEPDPTDDKELDQYIREFEEMLGVTFAKGRGSAKCMSLTINPVDLLHRGITWYLCVGFVDMLTHLKMLYRSFQFHKTALPRSLAIFPPRPLAFFSSYHSPAEKISYWHRPHRSRNKLPILFIHGIGIGLYPYVNFLTELNEKLIQDTDDDEIGFIALEIMPISFRITHEALAKDDLCREIKRILAKHGWEDFVLVSHSYGSVISTHLLHTPDLAGRIRAILLIDPITLLLHVPDVAYNFTYRKPVRANEHQLYYFASKDMGVSHTLSRRFFWFENIMWKHDLEGRPVTVSLGGKDLIVDTKTVRDYLTRNAKESHTYGEDSSWKEGDWKGSGLDVLWFEDLDHAQVFDKKATRRRLVDVVRSYCSCDNAVYQRTNGPL